ncbi:hypothetical protein [Aquiflexum sp.]|uniref:hypothetical protein n=1 Tax=Aquiflexum sp. TaxID=1872584 RepID=UPI003593A8F6
MGKSLLKAKCRLPVHINFGWIFIWDAGKKETEQKKIKRIGKRDALFMMRILVLLIFKRLKLGIITKNINNQYRVFSMLKNFRVARD